MAIKATKLYCIIHYRGRVYCSYWSLQRDVVGEELVAWIGSGSRKVCLEVWQSKCNLLGKEFNISFLHKAHWNKISLDSRSSRGKANTPWQGSHRWELVWHDDQGSTNKEVWRLLSRCRRTTTPQLSREGEICWDPSLIGEFLENSRRF